MEIIVHPRQFSLQETQVFNMEGEPVSGMAIHVLDAMGTMVRIVFSSDDWENFRLAVTDPEEFQKVMLARQAEEAARSKIITPGHGAMATSVKERKH